MLFNTSELNNNNSTKSYTVLGHDVNISQWQTRLRALKSYIPSPVCSCYGNRVAIFRIVFMVMATTVLIVLPTYMKDRALYHEEFRIDYTKSELTSNKGFLVYGNYCKIPSMDPYVPEMMNEFRRWKYKPCSNKRPITAITFNKLTREYTIFINYTNVWYYNILESSLHCCYRVISRGQKKYADFNSHSSPCKNFTRTVLEKNIDFVTIECEGYGREMYRTGYALVQDHPGIRERLDKWRDKDRIINQKKKKKDPKDHKDHKYPNDNPKPPSVLMIGIDSISRVNLLRSMPRTAKYLYENDWFEMAGYNKVGDNTFPNLMAVFSGLNKSLATERCKPFDVGGLDNCNLIWYAYHKYGYVTAYAEDETYISTFNYRKEGFHQQPTDYYLRPFLITAEKKFHKTIKSSLTFCLGEQHSADYVYQYGLDVMERYRNDTYFGLFWSNTFSHNHFSDCTGMDPAVQNYLEQFTTTTEDENKIVIFFSDHGMRFGPTRMSISGYYEDRLPFLFIWLSPNLRQRYPQFVNALTINRNRLTCAYDLYRTLQHILELSGRVSDRNDLRPPDSCKHCRSLLEVIPVDRSCFDISIDAHWCTCTHYMNIYKYSRTVIRASEALVDEINTLLKGIQRKPNSQKSCAHLTLKNVEYVYYADFSSFANETHCRKCKIYRSVFSTNPTNSVFEGTVIHNIETDEFTMSGEISRLKRYSINIDCIADAFLEKYCYCQ